MAAIGGTRDARTDGRTAETTVVTIPTIRATMIVRGRTWLPVDGSTMPNARSRRCSPSAITRPNARPRMEAITPVTAASAMTDVRTCDALAPSALSSPSSRVRWATRIENVLKMMNVPTNSATPANTSRAMLKKDRPFLS